MPAVLNPAPATPDTRKGSTVLYFGHSARHPISSLAASKPLPWNVTGEEVQGSQPALYPLDPNSDL